MARFRVFFRKRNQRLLILRRSKWNCEVEAVSRLNINFSDEKGRIFVSIK